MNAAQMLHGIGQSIWIDNITRNMLDGGALEKYIREYAVTGLTSNPTIFAHAIKKSSDYEGSIRDKRAAGLNSEVLFFELAIEDLRRAADLFRPIHERTNGVDGWVSLEVSPLVAYDTKATINMARDLHERAERKNILIKIPGTCEGLPAIEESIFAGVPINVTLLFSREQYLAAAEAYLRGIERRIEAGLNPNVASVASLFISRWDVALSKMGGPGELKNQLGIAVARRTYRASRELLTTARWLRIYNEGARPQRLLWASTGTKDPQAPPLLYIAAFVAPYTVNTMPEATLKALGEESRIGDVMANDGGDCEELLERFAKAGIDVDALAAQLQGEGAKAFADSWNEVIQALE